MQTVAGPRSLQIIAPGGSLALESSRFLRCPVLALVVLDAPEVRREKWRYARASDQAPHGERAQTTYLKRRWLFLQASFANYY